MDPQRIVVTVTQASQVGPDTWRQDYQSHVFATSKTVDDMLAWARSLGFKNATINDLALSEYTGEST